MTRASTVAFVPRNRLASILTGPGGKPFAEHVECAREAVQEITPALVGSIEGDVRTLIRLCRQEEAELFGHCREIGWLALKVVETARLGGRPALAEAAKGVWEMIDALSMRGVWHTEALRLHVDALNALTPAAANGEAGQAMADALLRLRERLGAGPTP